MTSDDTLRWWGLRALCLVVLTNPAASLAQLKPCSQLPAAERAIARQQKLCTDDSPAALGAKAAAAANVNATRPAGCAPLPDFAVTSTTYADATRSLPQGFRPRVTERRPSSAPRDTVLEQSSERLEGTLCWANFVLSDGSLVRVPPLRGMTRDAAERSLRTRQLKLEAQERQSDAEAVGRVFTQAPEAGTEVARGSLVRVGIALAPTLEVPDVVGRQVDDAKQRLGRFAVTASTGASLRPAGEVLAQQPAAGAQARPGGQVALTVSDGSLVEVPAFEKRPIATARALLTKAQLTEQVVEAIAEVPIGTVVSQEPAAGSTAKRHSVVTLHVSAGVVIPNVVGRQEQDARAALDSFVVSTKAAESDRPVGEVLEQRPAPGTRVPARARVSLELSDGSIVIVPDLHGLTLADARVELLRAGDLSAVVSDGDARPSAVVDLSSPAAGTRVKRGSAIALTLVSRWAWWPWAAGAAALFVAVGLAAFRWLRSMQPRRAATHADAHFRASIEFNTRPIESRVGENGPPAISLHAELLRGAVEVRQHEGELL